MGVQQFEPRGAIPTIKELADIAKATFRDVPTIHVKARPLTFKGVGPDQVDRHWIIRQLRATNTTQQARADALRIDSRTLGSIINGKKEALAICAGGLLLLFSVG